MWWGHIYIKVLWYCYSCWILLKIDYNLGRSYKRAYEILLHGRAHNGVKTLFCQYDQCNYSTVYPGALYTHQKRHAPDFKVFIF